MLAHNVQGLLPWRTSNIMNVRRPEQRNFFIGRCEGRTEPWQQTDVMGTARPLSVKNHFQFFKPKPGVFVFNDDSTISKSQVRIIRVQRN